MVWLKRLLLVVMTIIFSSTITFVVIRTMPGDPIETLAMELQRNMGMSFEDATIRAKAMLNYDPDVPVHIQYVNYMKTLLSGDLGQSMQFKTPVVDVITAAMAWTLLISSVSLILSFILGSLLGMYCAWKRKTFIDPVVTMYDAIVGAVPSFVIAYLLVMLFSTKLGWFPARGNYDGSVMPGFNGPFIASVAYHAILPVMSWVLTSIGGWALGMKSVAVSTLGEDYITSARARGLSDKRIVWTYVGRNALLPQITQLAMQFGMMFSGSVLIENIFVYPGMGFFFGRAITARDYMLMQGMFLVITIAVVLANLLAEILYSVIDPRIREGA